MPPSKQGQQQQACERERREAASLEWLQELPAEWRGQVVAPARFDVFMEYEMAADRTIGRDANDEPCYCALRYLLTELRADDEDVFYETPAYAESVLAWRLHDLRWLTLRSIVDNFDRGTVRRFLTFSNSMPR